MTIKRIFNIQPMAYYHWASDPVKLRRMNYPQSGHPKPNGLWFDVNGSWKQWCEAAKFHPEDLLYRHTGTCIKKCLSFLTESVI